VSEAARPSGVPIRWVVAGAVALVCGTIGGGFFYQRHLQSRIYERAAMAVDEIPHDGVALKDAIAAVEEAQRAGTTVSLDEAAWNRLLYDELVADPDRAMRLHLREPFVELRMSQRTAPDRHLNAVLLAQLFVRDGGLGIAIRSGRVGGVSISRKEGEWVRTRIERQLTDELRRHPRTGRLFSGLMEVQVQGARIVLRYGGST
jgi:hypothetical protein